MEPAPKKAKLDDGQDPVANTHEFVRRLQAITDSSETALGDMLADWYDDDYLDPHLLETYDIYHILNYVPAVRNDDSDMLECLSFIHRYAPALINKKNESGHTPINWVHRRFATAIIRFAVREGVRVDFNPTGEDHFGLADWIGDVIEMVDMAALRSIVAHLDDAAFTWRGYIAFTTGVTTLVKELVSLGKAAELVPWRERYALLAPQLHDPLVVARNFYGGAVDVGEIERTQMHALQQLSRSCYTEISKPRMAEVYAGLVASILDRNLFSIINDYIDRAL